MYIISIIIAIFIFLFNYLKIPLLLFILIIITYMVIKEIKNRKYSRNPFKKMKAKTEIDYVLMMIQSLKMQKEIIINGNNIILIAENGIYFIKTIDYANKISGNLKDEYFEQVSGNKKIKVKNKLFNYRQEYMKYKSKIDEDIKKYVVIRNDCYFNLKGIADLKIICSRKLYYELEKEPKKYTINQISKIYSKLKM